MAKQFYVIDLTRGYTCHQGDNKQSCKDYITTCIDMWHRQPDEFQIAEGSADLKEKLKQLKNK